MITALESASRPCFGPSFTKFRDPEEDEETSDLAQGTYASIYVRVAWLALCTNPRTPLCDLFSGAVPDFSKVHKISACSMPGGVQLEPASPPRQAQT